MTRGADNGPMRTEHDHAEGTEGIAGSTILLVDDNHPNLELLTAYFDGLGAEVHREDRADRVLERVGSLRPDLIVLDVMMPRVSGFQLCERLKGDASTSSIPVLILTALGEVGDIERAQDAGADAFLTKPVAKAELLSHASALLVRSRADQQPRA